MGKPLLWCDRPREVVQSGPKSPFRPYYVVTSLGGLACLPMLTY